MRQEAILLVTYGSSAPRAQGVYEHMESEVKRAFPGMQVFWAYTSRIVRTRLAREGQTPDSPEMALARLMGSGFTHVAVLSFHTIPGLEFHQLYRNAQVFELMAGGLRKVMVADPLLSSSEDLKRTAQAIIKHLPSERQSRDAVVLMGHGSAQHAADAIYAALNVILQELDGYVFLASLQGYPKLEEILPKIRLRDPKRIFLMPFMSVPGQHAHRDLAGEGADSWKSILTASGYTCVPVLKGTTEYPAILEIWLEHLGLALRRLREEG